ncbi:MAG: hypothetical protein WC234_02120 [Endomicrobiaceae bacterium]
MKYLLLILLFLTLQIQPVYAVYVTNSDHSVYLNSNSAEFSQKVQWINLDSSIDYISPQVMQYTGFLPEDLITLEPDYFSEFDYIPNTENQLISQDNIKDLVFIKSENNAKIQVTYSDVYNNDITDGYPKMYYRKDSSSDSWIEISFNSIASDKFYADIAADYGIYDYFVVADNDSYPDIYTSPTKTFVVTERPHSFINLNTNLQDEKANQNVNVKFNWSASKGVESDILKYIFYIGTDSNSMQSQDLATASSYTADMLMSRTRYYWKVEVENQYGAKLLNPVIYTFVTLGEIARVYNAPNPFNPQAGEKTRVFFEMPESGSVQMNIYSEYGDKIYHVSYDNLSKGSNEILYDGKDDYGNILYNGTYLCIIKKKYSGQTKTERCRLLIIK